MKIKTSFLFVILFMLFAWGSQVQQYSRASLWQSTIDDFKRLDYTAKYNNSPMVTPMRMSEGPYPT